MSYPDEQRKYQRMFIKNELLLLKNAVEGAISFAHRQMELVKEDKEIDNSHIQSKIIESYAKIE